MSVVGEPRRALILLAVLVVRFAHAAATVAVPLASLRSIAVHRRQRINGWRFAGYGVGGMLVGGLIGGTVGLLGGITLGLLHRSDRWELVSLGGVLVGVAPRGEGIRVGARIGI